jgi:hypothetical protein
MRATKKALGEMVTDLNEAMVGRLVQWISAISHSTTIDIWDISFRKS